MVAMFFFAISWRIIVEDLTNVILAKFGSNGHKSFQGDYKM